MTAGYYHSIVVALTFCVAVLHGFHPMRACHHRAVSSDLHIGLNGFFTSLSGGSESNIPKSSSDRSVHLNSFYTFVNILTNNALQHWKCRDQKAIEAIKAAIKNPKTPSLPLIECEFPPLAELNKLGDGSLRSANLVDDVSITYLTLFVPKCIETKWTGPTT